MTHIPKEDDEEPRRRSSPRSYSIIDRLFEQLTAVELSSTLQVQRTAAQSTISALESKVTALEGLVHAQCQPRSPIEVTLPPEPAPPPPKPDSITQVLNEFVEQRSSVREEWASERERLSSARKEWENLKTNLGTAAAKFDAGLASLVLLQRQQQQSRGEVNRGVERVCSTTSLGRLYPPSLPDD
jgi:hypothetical protein